MESMVRSVAMLKHVLFGVLIFGASQVQSQTCMADFFFSYLDSATIHIYNHSEGYDSVSWSVSEGQVLSETALTLTLLVPNGRTEVCLRIFSAAGCSDELCIPIYPGAPGDICSLTDCVWPGDANGDRLANNYDLLHIGMGYGRSGPERAYYPLPHDPLAWTPSHAENWEQWAGIVNFKHLDCDGNGTVDANDLKAIYRNYRPDETYEPKSHPGAPPVELVLDEDLFIIDQNNQPDSIVVTGSVFAGSEAFPFENLYGLAFTVTYDTSQTRQGSARFEVVPNSFFGESHQLIELNANLDSTRLSGRTDYALSRTAQIGANGYGALATFSLVIEGDIIGGRNINDINVKMSKVRAVDSLGNTLPFNLINDELTVLVVNDNITSTREPEDASSILLFPNPAKGEVRFQALTGAWNWLEIFNAQGQRIETHNLPTDQKSIPLQGLPSGTYWVKAWSADGRWTSATLTVH